MMIRRLARKQIASTKWKNGVLPEAVACGWVAVGGVSESWVKDKFDISCPSAITPSAIGPCTGRPDRWYCDIERDHLVHCTNGSVDKRTDCPTDWCVILANGVGAQCLPLTTNFDGGGGG